MLIQCLLISIGVLVAGGCGTTKWSDTTRTGTEQLLISNAIDRVVDKIDFSPLQDKKCFLNTAAIEHTTDRSYLAMTVRQRLATAGAILADNASEADYIVEIRAGAVGTDRDDLLVGIPATTVPALPGTQYAATSIPEIPFMKRTKQRGVAKIALFAYNKETGRPVWTSGNRQGESAAQNFWFAGTGPLTRGTILHEPTFAGNSLPKSVKRSVRTQPVQDSRYDESQVFPEHMRTPLPPQALTPRHSSEPPATAPYPIIMPMRPVR